MDAAPPVPTRSPSPLPAAPLPPSRRRRSWARPRDTGASVLVSALSSAFGVVLLAATGFIGDLLASADYLQGRESVVVIIAILSWLLLGVAVFVASIVTATTFAAVVAGRVRGIALLRLLGASAGAQRSAVARDGLWAGAFGAVLGFVLGIALSGGGIAAAVAVLDLTVTMPYAGLLSPVVLVPPVAVALTTWGSAWAGSARVLRVSPLEALAASGDRSRSEITRRTSRNVVAICLLVLGFGVLALGVLAGLVTPLGVVPAFVGGLVSFVGVALAAPLFMPPVLRLVGRAFGRSAVARLAAENAMRHPERASRMTIGVVLGVTLVTMFAAGLASARTVLVTSAGEPDPEFLRILESFSSVMMLLTAVSALIAAVGLVNLLTLGVVQRRREFGLLRALGLSTRQIRAVVLIEAAHLTLTALVVGLVLGIVYGWAGAQSVLGSVGVPPSYESPTFVLPAVPVGTVLVVVAVTAVLTLVSAVVPTRHATSVTPVEALADA
ncbi:FtsX-like permease family protein [Microbacterium sp. HMH0099]|uniref:ABC transporter permease n=1 Tax=Microbacterium sp. HMH0099 TaxID=3414026 RepID=UPI003BF6CBC8